MKLEVDFGRGYIFVILGIVLVLGIVGVNAYNSGYGDPSIMGHSADEIDGLDNLGGSGVEAIFCGHDSSDSRCKAAQSNRGIGDGVWRAINCERPSVTQLLADLRYTNNRWNGWRGDLWENCVDDSILVLKVG
jgi:hypothetical protein